MTPEQLARKEALSLEIKKADDEAQRQYLLRDKAYKERDGLIIQEVLEALNGTAWDLVGGELYTKDRHIVTVIGKIWPHDYHEMIQNDEVRLRFDDFEHTLRFKSMEKLVEFVKSHGIKIKNLTEEWLEQKRAVAKGEANLAQMEEMMKKLDIPIPTESTRQAVEKAIAASKRPGVW